MAQKEIKILGKNAVPVAFNMATQIAWERITDKAFDLALLSHAEARMALYFASIISADKDTTITMDDIMIADWNDIQLLDKTLNELVSEFYHLGKVEEAHVPVVAEEPEEEAKN